MQKLENVLGMKHALEDTQEERETTAVKHLDFCNIHDLFISNSAFQHPARHISTWEFTREVNNKVIHIYNQLDYIVCPGNRKKVLIVARSYGGMQVNSNHRIVVCRLRIEPFELFWKAKSTNKTPFNCSTLIRDEIVQTKYKNEIEKELQQCNSNDWKTIKEIIISSLQNHLGYVEKVGPDRRIHDQDIQEMSEKQKQLRSNLSRCNDATKQKAIKRNETRSCMESSIDSRKTRNKN